MNNLKVNEVKVGVILSYIIVALNMIIGVAYLPFLTYSLGQSEYGLYSLVYTTMSYLTILDFGFANAIVIYTAKYRQNNDEEKERKLHGMFLTIYTVIGVIAGICGLILMCNVENLFGATLTVEELSKAKILMGILSFNLLITFPFSIFNSIITAYEKFVFAKCVNILRIILAPIIMIPFLLFGYKSITLVIILTLVNIFCSLLNTFYCIKKLNIKFALKGFDIPLLKEISIFSFFIFLSVIIDKINWTVDHFILGATLGTVAVAIYSVSAQFNTMYIAFSTAISNILLPRISKMVARNASNEEFTDVFIKTGRLQYIIMALIITGFVLFGHQFILFLFGAEYDLSYYIACILMLPVTLPLIQNIGISILQAKNLHKFRTLVFLGIAICNVILSIILVNIYGVIGCAVGTAISLILGQGLILNIYYHKKIHIDILKFWKEIIEMTIPVLVVFILGFVMREYFTIDSILAFCLQIVLYVIVYAIFMWYWGMNSYEKNLVNDMKDKVIMKLRRG